MATIKLSLENMELIVDALDALYEGSNSHNRSEITKLAHFIEDLMDEEVEE